MPEVTDRELDCAAVSGRVSPDEVMDALLSLIGLIIEKGEDRMIFDARYSAAREVAKAYL